MRARADCADLVAQGSIRINRQPTDKPHARLRIGDVLTLPIHGSVRVLRVASLGIRRGSAAEARLLYVDIGEAETASGRVVAGDAGDGGTRNNNDMSAPSCIAAESPAYPDP